MAYKSTYNIYNTSQLNRAHLGFLSADTLPDKGSVLLFDYNLTFVKWTDFGACTLHLLSLVCI